MLQIFEIALWFQAFIPFHLSNAYPLLFVLLIEVPRIEIGNICIHMHKFCPSLLAFCFPKPFLGCYLFGILCLLPAQYTFVHSASFCTQRLLVPRKISNSRSSWLNTQIPSAQGYMGYFNAIVKVFRCLNLIQVEVSVAGSRSFHY